MKMRHLLVCALVCLLSSYTGFQPCNDVEPVVRQTHREERRHSIFAQCDPRASDLVVEHPGIVDGARLEPAFQQLNPLVRTFQPYAGGAGAGAEQVAVFFIDKRARTRR